MDKCYGIIYKATNKANGKAYIGQTVKSLNKRMGAHINNALNNEDNFYFHRAVRKYGKENFKWGVIKECNSIEELNAAEIEMIEKYNTFGNGYNLTKGGEGNVGFRHTEESRKKMSESRKGKNNPMYGNGDNRKGEKNYFYGKHHSEETRRKISEARKGKNHPNYGKHLSEETKRKISVSGKGKHDTLGKNNPMYGRKQTKETRQKISNAYKGKKLSEEVKFKISEAFKGEKNSNYGKRGKDSANFGKKRSEESKQKISLALKGKYGGKNSPWYGKRHSEETKKKMSRSMIGKQVGSKSAIAKKYIIITPESEEIFVHGLRDFCKNYKKDVLCSSTLIKVANGKQKQHKGYKCEYVEESLDVKI